MEPLNPWTAIRKSMDALSVIAEAAATEAIQPPAKRPHGHQSSRHAFQELARGSRPPLVEFNEDLWLGRDRYGGQCATGEAGSGGICPSRCGAENAGDQ
jgi:hypothetical protein